MPPGDFQVPRPRGQPILAFSFWVLLSVVTLADPKATSHGCLSATLPGLQVEILLPRDDQVHACVIPYRMNWEQGRGVRNPEAPVWVASSTQTPELYWGQSLRTSSRDASPHNFSWFIYLFLEVSADRRRKTLQLAPRSHQDFGLKKEALKFPPVSFRKRREEKSLIWPVCV